MLLIFNRSLYIGHSFISESLCVCVSSDQLQKKDEQIVTLLEEKVRLFRELCDCANQDDASLRNRMLFRAASDVTKGEPIIKDALKEGETRNDEG